MYEFIDKTCGGDAFWDYIVDAPYCENCHEHIWNADDLLDKKAIIEVDNRKFIESCKEAA